jgi:hypothetical protein
MVDRSTSHLIDTATFTGADFSIQRGDGICRPNHELARRVAQLSVEHCAASSQSVVPNGE